MVFKAQCILWSPGQSLTVQMLLMMKFTTILLLVVSLQVCAKTYGQTVTLDEQNASLEKIFRQVYRQTGFEFFYESQTLKQAKKVNIKVTNASVEVVLEICFRDQPFVYSIIASTVVIRPKLESNKPNVDGQPGTGLTISGVIADQADIPLDGASVKVKGTTNGISADKNGRFLLTEVPPDAILTVSFVGFEDAEVPVANRNRITIQLKRSVDKLSETVVIGYGTTTRRKATGSISSITSDEISRQPVANPLNALQGRIAGAFIFQSNGLPGSRVTVQIRGINSLNSGLQPLFIIDGVPFNMLDQAVPVSNDINSFGLFAANEGISPFSMINPADIDRIDVLKDADATAIYGSKAANGVVLITTKKGKPGKTRLDLNFYKGAGSVSRYVPMMNLQQYLQLRREAFANDGITPNVVNAPDLLLWDTTRSVDWQRKYVGGTANITDVQATISGGDVRTRVLFSAGFHRETTVYPGDFGDSRISIRANADHNSLDKKFSIVLNSSYAYNKTDLISEDLATAYMLPPNMPAYNPDGTLFWNTNFTNPESYLLQPYYGKTNNFMANTVMKYTLLPGLDLKTNITYNDIAISQNIQRPATSKNPIGTNPTNSSSFADVNQKSYTIEPQVTYNTNAWKGKLTLLGGASWQSSLNTSTTINADNYSSPLLLGSPSGAGTTNVGSTHTLYKYNSVFGRLNYDWKSKYILNINFRRDGSSRFAPQHRFGNFGSAAAAWIFTNEKFATKTLSFLSFGKLRMSYGITGNDQIQDYLYMTLFASSGGSIGYQGSSVLIPQRINNSELHWESNKKLEFALELGLLKDRIQFTANYYRHRTGEQLGSLRLAFQSGTNSYTSNFDALIENKGWEFELNAMFPFSKDFVWKPFLNLTIPSTKLLSASDQYFSYNPMSLGQPLSYQLKYAYLGVDPQTGRPLYHNVSKDSATFTPNAATDRYVAGFTAPKFYGGFSNIFTYKRFECSFFLEYTSRKGNIIPTALPGGLGNRATVWTNRWRKPGDVAALPRATTTSSIYSNFGGSDAVWGDASYIRLRNATISYSLPQAVLSKISMSNIKLFVQGQNLFTWTKHDFVSDPETIATINQSPVVMQPLRIITAGINCSF